MSPTKRNPIAGCCASATNGLLATVLPTNAMSFPSPHGFAPAEGHAGQVEVYIKSENENCACAAPEPASAYDDGSISRRAAFFVLRLRGFTDAPPALERRLIASPVRAAHTIW